MAVQHHESTLVFLRWGIGDLVLQWPVLEAARAAGPESQLTFMAAAPAAQLLEGSGLADRVVTYQELGARHMGDARDAVARGAGRWLADHRFDALVDTLTAPPAIQRAAWRQEVWHYESDRGEIRRWIESGAGAAAALARGAENGWGLPVAVDATRRSPPFGSREDPARKRLAEAGVRPGFVAMVPFASHPLKRWPEERFVALARRLLGRGRDVLLLAAPEDGAAGRVAEALSPAAGVAVLPPDHLLVTGAVLSHAALAVGSDTGLLHLAAAGGTPAVSIFGPSDHRIYAPAGRTDLAVAAGRPCRYRQSGSMSPPECWLKDRCLIGASSCTTDVPPEDVLERVWRALDEAGRRDAA